MLRKVHLSQQWLVRLEDLEDRLVKAEESVQHADGFDAIISVLLDRYDRNRYGEERLGSIRITSLRQTLPLFCESEEVILLGVSVRVGCQRIGKVSDDRDELCIVRGGYLRSIH